MRILVASRNIVPFYGEYMYSWYNKIWSYCHNECSVANIGWVKHVRKDSGSWRQNFNSWNTRAAITVKTARQKSFERDHFSAGRQFLSVHAAGQAVPSRCIETDIPSVNYRFAMFNFLRTWRIGNPISNYQGKLVAFRASKFCLDWKIVLGKKLISPDAEPDTLLPYVHDENLFRS